jgi:hypothetical protein
MMMRRAAASSAREWSTAGHRKTDTVRVVTGDTPNADANAGERRARPGFFTRYRRLREFLAGPDRYGAVLIVLIAIFVMLGLSEDSRWLRLVVVPALIVTLEFILSTSGASRRVRHSTWVVDGIVVMVAVTQVLFFNAGKPYATYMACAAITVTGMVFVFRRILEHAVISTETLFAAASMYVLIGLSFAFILLSVAMIVGPDYLSGAERQPSDYVYASFITMTTVGYGDIVPVAKSARVLMSLEALTGVLFLATIISRLVSGFGQSRTDVVREPETRRGES